MIFDLQTLSRFEKREVKKMNRNRLIHLRNELTELSHFHGHLGTHDLSAKINHVKSYIDQILKEETP